MLRLEPPRSVLLALWASAVVRGEADPSEAARAVQSADADPHRIVGDDLPVSADPLGPGLFDWLDWLAHRDVRAVRAVLPVPGDVMGVPGGPEVSQVMLAAGEGVVTMPGQIEAPCWALACSLIHFGSELEPGVSVQWEQVAVVASGPTPLGALVGASEAQQRLRSALALVTAELTDLDVADSPAGFAGALEGVRRAGLDARRFPPGTSPRVLSLVDRAVRVRQIVALARTQEGAARTGWQLEQRQRHLVELDTAARHALAALTVPAGWG